MEATTKQGAAPTGGTRREECCTDGPCDSGVRNNYYEGKRLTPRSFAAEQRYLVERRRLLNRAVHGWGVVHGLAVGDGRHALKQERPFVLRIGPGLALDACGRELWQPQEIGLGIRDLLVLDADGLPVKDPEAAFAAPPPVVTAPAPAPAPAPAAPAAPGRLEETPGKPTGIRGRISDEVLQHLQEHVRRGAWLLRAHYTEKGADPVSVTDRCCCEHHAWDRTCETVRYSLQRATPPGADGLECHCEEPQVVAPHRGGRCLCVHLTGLQPGSEDGRLCEIEEPCGDAHVALHHGVPLALVDVVKDECGHWVGRVLDACGPRRLVKRNDLLFDLLDGRDLTRVADFGWQGWVGRQIPFADFRAGLHRDPVLKDQPKPEYVTKTLWVDFSRPVRAETLRDSFAITVLTPNREGGWWEPRRVPVVRVDAEPATAEYTQRATVVVDGSWIEDEVEGSRTEFDGGESVVEIEVRGDFIVDCNGQTVDANPAGVRRTPGGNGTPGGTFLSTFRVAAREHEKPNAHNKAE